LCVCLPACLRVSLFLRNGDDKIKIQSQRKTQILENSDTIIHKNQNFERVLNSNFSYKKSQKLV
jgi:hypothetical protein